MEFKVLTNVVKPIELNSREYKLYLTIEDLQDPTLLKQGTDTWITKRGIKQRFKEIYPNDKINIFILNYNLKKLVKWEYLKKDYVYKFPFPHLAIFTLNRLKVLL